MNRDNVSREIGRIGSGCLAPPARAPGRGADRSYSGALEGTIGTLGIFQVSPPLEGTKGTFGKGTAQKIGMRYVSRPFNMTIQALPGANGPLPNGPLVPSELGWHYLSNVPCNACLAILV